MLISALANQPLNQQIAVTGSVDQFGNVQPVGGLNEKIEGFFHICQSRELTGKQGVILPASNVRHLSLSDDVVEAVLQGQFHIWAIERVDEALPLLTGIAAERKRRLAAEHHSGAHYSAQSAGKPTAAPPLRWLNWFNHS